jgi:hypothetical protein
MIKKMNFIRFCRRSLTALPVFLVFSSCDKILSPSGTGELVQVKIRAVSIAGGAKNETVTRASGASRMVGEPVIQDLGGGMFAEIAVEEDVSALRDGEGTTLANSALYRVIVLNSDGNYVAHKDFTMGAEPGEIALQEGSYSFICFSFNTSAKLPDAGNGAGSDFTFAATTASEIYWQKQSVTLPLEADVSFLLKPQFVKVKLKLDAGWNRTITTIDNAKPISLDAPTSGSFNLATGNFTGSGSFSFSGWSSTGERRVTSGEFTFLPKATGTYALSFAAGALTKSGVPWTSAAWTSYFVNSKFAAGGSYTIVARLNQRTSYKFAGSNIYWDGSKLTFDLYGSNDNTKYQGVFFKWGSLIGVSPAEADDSPFSSGTAANEGKNDGTPIYMKDPFGNWVKTNVAYATSQGWFGNGAVSNEEGYDVWKLIPYGSSVEPYDMDAYTLLTLYSDFAGYRGDICNYIDPAYRMPTGAELRDLGKPTSGATSSTTSDDPTGKYVFNSNNFCTFTIGDVTLTLPASGYRFNGTGKLDAVGDGGYYNSGTADDALSAYYLFFKTDTGYTYTAIRAYGHAVRCVKIE